MENQQVQDKIDKLKVSFIDKLKPSGWDMIFKDFAEDSKFRILMQDLLHANSETGITPNSKQMFRAFTECPFKDLKVLMIGQDPYPKPGVADGISFSCSNTMKVQPSLKAIFKELEDTVYPDGYEWNPDLSRWSNQGVLMLNTALTTTPSKIGQHYKMWKPFMGHLLTQLILKKEGLIYVFMGSAAKEWSKVIPNTNVQMFCYHPASACYHGGQWDSNDLFNRINAVLKSQNEPEIIW